MHQASRLRDELRKIGGSPLLWVSLAERLDQVGTVENLGDGLLHGFIDRFSPNENVASYCSFDVWLVLCRQARNQWRPEAGLGAS